MDRFLCLRIRKDISLHMESNFFAHYFPSQEAMTFDDVLLVFFEVIKDDAFVPVHTSSLQLELPVGNNSFMYI